MWSSSSVSEYHGLCYRRIVIGEVNIKKQEQLDMMLSCHGFLQNALEAGTFGVDCTLYQSKHPGNTISSFAVICVTSEIS